MPNFSVSNVGDSYDNLDTAMTVKEFYRLCRTKGLTNFKLVRLLIVMVLAVMVVAKELCLV